MTRRAPRPDHFRTIRWSIKRIRAYSGRKSGTFVWVVSRYRWGSDLARPTRVTEAVLGFYPTLPAAMDSARRDCAVFYDERSRP